MPRAQRIRHFLLVWHRRLGASAALVVVWLALSGVVLNHTEALQLAAKPVRNSFVLARYGIAEPGITSFDLGSTWLNQVGGRRLFLGEQDTAECAAPLRGAVQLQQQIIALCGTELLLLTPGGAVIERLNSSHGVPAQVRAIAAWGNKLWLATAETAVMGDPQRLDFKPAKPPFPSAAWSAPRHAPQAMQQALKQQYIGTDITLERVLLDLHSGRLLGHWGVYVMDLAAVALCLLAGSGLWVWTSAKWRRRARNRE